MFSSLKRNKKFLYSKENNQTRIKGEWREDIMQKFARILPSTLLHPIASTVQQHDKGFLCQVLLMNIVVSRYIGDLET